MDQTDQRTTDLAALLPELSVRSGEYLGVKICVAFTWRRLDVCLSPNLDLERNDVSLSPTRKRSTHPLAFWQMDHLEYKRLVERPEVQARKRSAPLRSPYLVLWTRVVLLSVSRRMVLLLLKEPLLFQHLLMLVSRLTVRSVNVPSVRSLRILAP
jgi:hypothetical protein